MQGAGSFKLSTPTCRIQTLQMVQTDLRIPFPLMALA